MNSGATFSYAQLWAPMNNPGIGMVGTVDASAFTGVQFYAIINTAPTGARFRVGNLFTDPVGGMCSLDTTKPTSCYDHPGMQLTPSTTWTKYQVPFTGLTQAGFGNPSPLGDAFPRSAITVIRCDINIPSTGPTAAWELWVDDVTFTRRRSLHCTVQGPHTSGARRRGRRARRRTRCTAGTCFGFNARVMQLSSRT